MFDIGFAELLIVAVVALVVLGPEKLPTAARTVGLWVGRIRRTLSGIQSEISEELRIDEMKRTAAIKKEELEKELAEMRTPFNGSAGDDSPFGNSVMTPDELQAKEQVKPQATQPDTKRETPAPSGNRDDSAKADNS